MKDAQANLCDALATAAEQIQTMILKKNTDYGGANIGFYGEHGVLVRTTDKVLRLKNLLWDNPPATPDFESIQDTWADLAAYALIGMLVHSGEWYAIHCPSVE